MKQRINWGGPAFPPPDPCLHLGMTVREFLAAAALTGLLARKGVQLPLCGRLAVTVADSVLRALEEDSQ